ncbi:MAG TPA: hypothetical protein VMP01_14235 [Pirellulaceae bacterium]|nr:hypothetical protein [Pirellulaceae bacterium]
MTLGLALAALSLLAVASPTRAEERPIKGSGSGALNLDTARMLAVGDVAHLGESRVLFFLEQSLLDGNEIQVSVCAFIAANGDFVWVDVQHNVFDPETGVLMAKLSFLPQLSSGRFADVEGSADLLIMFEDWTDIFGNPSFVFFLDGVIDY